MKYVNVVYSLMWDLFNFCFSEGVERLPFKPGGYNFWTWRGHKIHYVEQGEGFPIILIHGFGASAFHWRLIILHPSFLHELHELVWFNGAVRSIFTVAYNVIGSHFWIGNGGMGAFFYHVIGVFSKTKMLNSRLASDLCSLNEIWIFGFHLPQEYDKILYFLIGITYLSWLKDTKFMPLTC